MRKRVISGLLVVVFTGGASYGLIEDAQAAPALPAGISLFHNFKTVRVKRGDTLSAISRRYCGTPNDYPSIAAASGIIDANFIVPGERLVIRCYGGDGGDQYAAAAVAYSYYSWSGLETLWREAGGSRWTESAAACIAEHESGGYVYAVSPTDDYGLWQINRPSWGSALATFYPLGNAEAAVKISDDGTDWGPWTTAPDCGL